MVEGAEARLSALPTDLTPLADAARTLLDQPAGPSADGVLRLGHRPWVAPENYTLTLYPGLPADALDRYAARFGLNVPPVYAAFLAAVNGAFCFGMSLAGVPASMIGSPPLLDRRTLQCHDLGSSATQWASEYLSYRPEHLGLSIDITLLERTSVTSSWVAAFLAFAKAGRWSVSGAGWRTSSMASCQHRQRWRPSCTRRVRLADGSKAPRTRCCTRRRPHYCFSEFNVSPAAAAGEHNVRWLVPRWGIDETSGICVRRARFLHSRGMHAFRCGDG